jgi:penicillin-binding protein
MNTRKKKKRRKNYTYFILSMAFTGILGMIFLIILLWTNPKAVQFGNIVPGHKTEAEQPEDLLKLYFGSLLKADYKTMYSMLDEQSQINISQGEFVSRNQKIYEGIEAKNIKAEITEIKEQVPDTVISYHTSLESLAGTIEFNNQAVFSKNDKGKYVLSWNDSMIFPKLTSKDKVKVTRHGAKRGKILDRNSEVLAGPGTASLVGVVPGKLNQEDTSDIKELAALLDIKEEAIEKALDAKWVKTDSFVPLKTIEKLDETDMLTDNPGNKTLENKALQESLIKIPGVMITDTSIRTYPFGRAASHLTGYVQKVTAEDLKKHKGEGYNSSSVIGRSGVEGLYEKELKGKDGYEIDILTSDSLVKEILASLPKEDGRDITLTIDGRLQKSLYEEFKEDKSCTVSLNPYTGEVLALVSTPAFDSNDFIRGLSEKQWNQLNEDKDKPLYNRFRQRWCPGSSLKPIIGAIGLTTGAIDPEEDFGSEGKSWKKDASWGGYSVTTLHTYKPVILENALIYSDNIYFAKAALKIGRADLEQELDRLGFHQKFPFEITMAEAKYSNTETIETEIQLADSGYGQGQILINPLHLAALYTAFANEGNAVKPYLLQQENKEPEIWLDQAFSAEDSKRIKTALIKVVNTREGTGYAAHRSDINLAGKTGTAEIKASKEDNKGTELGWFGVFTADKETKNPVLIMSMVEDVKNRGGSAYVVKKVKAVLDSYFYDNR